jgi:asparagine synthase (glutamine-hydrolysing)
VGNTFDRKAVTGLLDVHESGRRDEAIRIWTLLSLEVWHQTYFGSPA